MEVAAGTDPTSAASHPVTPPTGGIDPMMVLLLIVLIGAISGLGTACAILFVKLGRQGKEIAGLKALQLTSGKKKVVTPTPPTVEEKKV